MLLLVVNANGSGSSSDTGLLDSKVSSGFVFDSKWISSSPSASTIHSTESVDGVESSAENGLVARVCFYFSMLTT